jgi:hypothetical protein
MKNAKQYFLSIMKNNKSIQNNKIKTIQGGVINDLKKNDKISTFLKNQSFSYSNKFCIFCFNSKKLTKNALRNVIPNMRNQVNNLTTRCFSSNLKTSTITENNSNTNSDSVKIINQEQIENQVVVSEFGSLVKENITINNAFQEETTKNTLISIEEVKNLHPYTIDILKRLNFKGFNPTQYKIFNAINKDLDSNPDLNKSNLTEETPKDSSTRISKGNNSKISKNSSESDEPTNPFLPENNHCMILSDLNSGRYFSLLLSLINRLLITSNKKMDNLVQVPDFNTENFFVSVEKEFQNVLNNKEKNKSKKYLTPRGALVITQRFEFASQLYKISRKLDYKGALKISRIGTTLQNISPVIEHLDDETEAQETEIEEICKINLLLNTQWALNDIMFISPVMMEFVLNNLDACDKFDINPEVIVVDDFDYLMSKKNKESYSTLEKILFKYFSPNSDFFTDSNKNRTLLLSSMSYDVFESIEEAAEYKKMREKYEKEGRSVIGLEEFKKRFVKEIAKDSKDTKDIKDKDNVINNTNSSADKLSSISSSSANIGAKSSSSNGKVDKEKKRLDSKSKTTSDTEDNNISSNLVSNNTENSKSLNSNTNNKGINNTQLEYAQLIKSEVTSFMRKITEEPNFAFENIIVSRNFMDFSAFQSTLNSNTSINQNNTNTSNNSNSNSINNKINFFFENCEDGKFEKRLKKLNSIITNSDLSKHFLVAVNSDKVLKHITEDFKKRKLNFSSIDKSTKINERLKAILDFNTNATNVLIGSMQFLRGLNFPNVDNIVFFELSEDPRDYVKMLSKFKSNYEGLKSNNCKFYFLISNF